MFHELICHPDTPSGAVDGIDVAIARPQPGVLALRYTVSGRIAEVSLAPPSAPLRAGELWRTTCFEAFVETAQGAGYYEFNLSPSSKWAAYHFTSYRDGMALAELSPPAIITGANVTHIDVDALIYLPPTEGLWRLALAAVIEETNGVKSYWALKHPPGKPDFHHADAFVVELA
ncbi:MAG: DOMON-like domain-containing protein [Phycisphaerales bacterium]|nr:DOMON-like domain-containing protein [Hyphomonadaceae bacterium]